jgi:hypothetical protein
MIAKTICWSMLAVSAACGLLEVFIASASVNHHEWWLAGISVFGAAVCGWGIGFWHRELQKDWR